MDNFNELRSKLTADEFSKLNSAVFEKYNMPFKLESVDDTPEGKVVTVRLSNGVSIHLRIFSDTESL